MSHTYRSPTQQNYLNYHASRSGITLSDKLTATADMILLIGHRTNDQEFVDRVEVVDPNGDVTVVYDA